jgi:hypothetical protein
MKAMSNAKAKIAGDFATPKQLWMIRTLCAELGADPEGEAQRQFGCNLEELSKRAASELIEALKNGDGAEEGQENHKSEAAQESASAPAQPEEIQPLEDRKAKPQANGLKRFARPLAEIMADLSKPIERRHLKTKQVGKGDRQREVTYVPWYNAIRYLDHYAPGWSYRIANIAQIGKSVVVVAEISIVAAEGVITRQATGIEDDEVSGYGDPSSNAESMALRRAAAKFGLGLYLYDRK